MNLFTKQKQTHRQKNKPTVTKGERGRGGINQEYGVNRNTLLYVKQIKVLIMQHRKLYSIPIMINNLKKKNLYAGQETTVRTRHGTTDWFKIGKRAH